MRKPKRFRRAGVLSGAFALAALGATAIHVWQDTRDQNELERRTLELASTLRTGLATPVESLFSVQAFLQVPRENGLSSAQFSQFAAPAIQRHPEIAALEWFPLVSASQRVAFERRVAEEQPNYRIIEPTRSGNMVPAVERALYIPLTYMEPAVPTVLGLDLAFDPLRVEPVQRALDSGLVTLSDRFQLVEDPEGVMSVAVYAPVTAAAWVSRDSVHRFERGVAVALFRLNPLIDQILTQAFTRGLHFELWDPRAADQARLIHESGPIRRGARTTAAQIPFVDREYRLLVASSSARFGWAAPLVFLVTFGMSVLGVAYVDLRRRERRLQRKAEKLGQYHVEGRIASGGMGTVYRARHALLRRPTAIKIAKESQVAASFEKEVLLTSQLTHPNTIMVYDFGRGDDGSFYCAMEYIDGYDLEELVQRHGPLPPARAIRLLLQAAASLTEAHDKGLVHRDIKPSNLMVTERGGVRDFVKVLDFGLARPQVTNDASAGPVSTTFAGTPGYVAPEVIAGQSASVASDVFSLGAVGYHLVSGHGPFSRASSVAEALTLALTTRPPPPPAVPQSLAKLLDECLSREPTSRPRGMAALAERLKRALADCSPWTAEDAERWWSEHPPHRPQVQQSVKQTFVPKGHGLSSSSTNTES